RSLMLPIAVLPAAALLQRFGQPDKLGADGLARFAGWLQPVADTLGAAGSALFDNLPIIFAVGVAIGFAKKTDGAPARPPSSAIWSSTRSSARWLPLSDRTAAMARR